MFCYKCGAQNIDDAKFCASCGIHIGKLNVQELDSNFNLKYFGLLFVIFVLVLCIVAFATDKGLSGFAGFIGLIIAVLIFILPYILAYFKKDKPSSNIFAGIGFFIFLIPFAIDLYGLLANPNYKNNNIEILFTIPLVVVAYFLFQLIQKYPKQTS